MISNPYAVHLPAFNQHRTQFYHTLSNKVRTLAIQIRTLLGEDPQKVNEELDRALHVEPIDPKVNLLDALNRPDGLLVEKITSITNPNEGAAAAAASYVKAAATGGGSAVHHQAGSSKLDEEHEEEEEEEEDVHRLLSAAQEAAAIEAGCADYLFEMARYAKIRLIVPDLHMAKLAEAPRPSVELRRTSIMELRETKSDAQMAEDRTDEAMQRLPPIEDADETEIAGSDQPVGDEAIDIHYEELSPKLAQPVVPGAVPSQVAHQAAKQHAKAHTLPPRLQRAKQVPSHG